MKENSLAVWSSKWFDGSDAIEFDVSKMSTNVIYTATMNGKLHAIIKDENHDIIHLEQIGPPIMSGIKHGAKPKQTIVAFTVNCDDLKNNANIKSKK